MEIQKAKELVVEAGKKLVETGLIARTWGNVSCRVSETQFVITPSGRAYETLTPEEVVLVNIEDCSYDGDIKPSSEKGIHADSYRLRPEVNFVIHTHQVEASVLSPTGINITNVYPDAAPVIGKEVVCAAYGMPSTGKLREGVASALENAPYSKAFIMKHHGALCLGKDYEEAFQVAATLEDVCRRVFIENYRKRSGAMAYDTTAMHNFFLSKTNPALTMPEEIKNFYSSEREGDVFRLYTPGQEEDAITVDVETGVAEEGIAPREAKIHAAIYRATDFQNIIQSTNSDVVAVSVLGKTMHPLLDDFAQIAGTTVRSVSWEDGMNMDKFSDEIVNALKGRNCVLIQGHGALCASHTQDDAHACQLVMEKGCRTQIGATLFHRINYISPVECFIMRLIYTQKYSKQKDEK